MATALRCVLGLQAAPLALCCCCPVVTSSCCPRCCCRNRSAHCCHNHRALWVWDTLQSVCILPHPGLIRSSMWAVPPLWAVPPMHKVAPALVPGARFSSLCAR